MIYNLIQSTILMGLLIGPVASFAADAGTAKEGNGISSGEKAKLLQERMARKKAKGKDIDPSMQEKIDEKNSKHDARTSQKHIAKGKDGSKVKKEKKTKEKGPKTEGTLD